MQAFRAGRTTKNCGGVDVRLGAERELEDAPDRRQHHLVARANTVPNEALNARIEVRHVGVLLDLELPQLRLELCTFTNALLNRLQGHMVSCCIF